MVGRREREERQREKLEKRQHNAKKGRLYGIIGAAAAIAAIGIAFYFISDGFASVRAIHSHAHLSISVDGENVEIPSQVGIDAKYWHDHSFDLDALKHDGIEAMSAIHTHDNTGSIHIESKVSKEYTLGNLLTVWGFETYQYPSWKMKVTHINGVIEEYDSSGTTYMEYVLQDGDTIKLDLFK